MLVEVSQRIQWYLLSWSWIGEINPFSLDRRFLGIFNASSVMHRYNMDTTGKRYGYDRDVDVAHRKWIIGCDMIRNVAHFEVFVHHSWRLHWHCLNICEDSVSINPPWRDKIECDNCVGSIVINIDLFRLKFLNFLVQAMMQPEYTFPLKIQNRSAYVLLGPFLFNFFFLIFNFFEWFWRRKKMREVGHDALWTFREERERESCNLLLLFFIFILLLFSLLWNATNGLSCFVAGKRAGTGRPLF